MSEDFYDAELLPLTGSEFGTLKAACAVLVGYYLGSGTKPCFFLFTADTGWSVPLGVCGCNLPRLTVRRYGVVS